MLVGFGWRLPAVCLLRANVIMVNYALSITMAVHGPAISAPRCQEDSPDSR